MSPQEKKEQRLKTQRKLRKLIHKQVSGHDHWVLIGGPPCQAYSLAGRSRMQGVVRRNNESEEEYDRRKKSVIAAFESDHRHLLYREYLSIIADHWPPVFVMENVKGMLSAKLNDKAIFPMIREDLTDPQRALGLKGSGHKYRICSLSVQSLVPGEGLEGKDFVIRAEKHGVPQKRHRIILLGIRDDVPVNRVPVLQRSEGPNLRNLFSGLPPLLPQVSKPTGVSIDKVVREIRAAPWLMKLSTTGSDPQNADSYRVREEVEKALKSMSIAQKESGGDFMPMPRMKRVPGRLGDWLADSRLGGICNNSVRSHMAADLHRYLFVSSFGAALGRSPKLGEFPESLLPDHSNVKGDKRDLLKFADRFRVQLYGLPAATITCHISQDGHANIHPDPRQMRSLTVREAARIQTFPDNYFFEGTRTAQYKQVGNAVPPFLAHQIAEVVAQLFDDVASRKGKQTR